jgi:hypothetical protein
MIEVNDLHKKFGKVKVLNRYSFKNITPEKNIW